MSASPDQTERRRCKRPSIEKDRETVNPQDATMGVWSYYICANLENTLCIALYNINSIPRIRDTAKNSNINHFINDKVIDIISMKKLNHCWKHLTSRKKL